MNVLEYTHEIFVSNLMKEAKPWISISASTLTLLTLS